MRLGTMDRANFELFIGPTGACSNAKGQRLCEADPGALFNLVLDYATVGAGRTHAIGLSGEPTQLWMGCKREMAGSHASLRTVRKEHELRGPVLHNSNGDNDFPLCMSFFAITEGVCYLA